MRKFTDLGTLLNIGVQFETLYTILKYTSDDEDNDGDGNNEDVDLFTMGFNVYYVFDFNFAVKPLVRIGYGSLYLNDFKNLVFESDALYYFIGMAIKVKSGDAFI